MALGCVAMLTMRATQSLGKIVSWHCSRNEISMSTKPFLISKQMLSIVKPNQGTQKGPYFIKLVREQSLTRWWKASLMEAARAWYHHDRAAVGDRDKWQRWRTNEVARAVSIVDLIRGVKNDDSYQQKTVVVFFSLFTILS